MTYFDSLFLLFPIFEQIFLTKDSRRPQTAARNESINGFMKKKDLSKHAKYTTSNPISQYLVNGFYTELSELYQKIPHTVKYIEVGCGEGLITNLLMDIKPPDTSFAIDLDPIEVADAQTNNPECEISVASIYDIPFDSDSFDLVVCCEVLEHLKDPAKAIRELHRISNKYALLSVPQEPLWRAMNMARLKYWSDWGNTPDHRNHWSRSEFKKFVAPFFNIIEFRSPTPWTMFLCEKK
ncbi:MAG: SAM-dependent methyltransferase [Bacteroidia bacterium]